MAGAAGALPWLHPGRPDSVIFVTLGTHPKPMTRLIVRLAVLAAERGWDVVVQTAAPVPRDDRLTVRSVLPHHEFLEAIRRAEVVISHAGPATLAAVRSAGKTAIVVPRSPRHGEHVDDHQERYARRLVGKPGYLVVADLDQLEWAVDRARTMEPADIDSDISRAVAVLEDLLDRR